VAAGAPYRFESAAWRRGVTRLAGVDEAGRGPLAGPVVAAAVVLVPGTRIAGVDDSKRVLAEERERLFEIIRARALAVSVAVVDHLTIDRINILQATRLAMAQALGSLAMEPELVLTDFVEVPGLGCPQRNLVDGDRRSASIAAASIMAKVTRDRIMEAADRDFPERHGPCSLHRQTFAGIWNQLSLFSRSELQWINADS
jgi:ribonuclease HII